MLKKGWVPRQLNVLKVPENVVPADPKDAIVMFQGEVGVVTDLSP
jgi:hypothetical protein